MKNFCLDLKEHATEIVNYEKKEMIALTNKEKIQPEQKSCYTCKKDLVLMMTIKNTLK